MADFIIDGTTFSGTPTSTSNPFKPNGYGRDRLKIGKLLIGKDGTVNWMHRGFKWIFTLGWERANQTTETAVLALRNKTSTFTFVDYNGTSYTVMTVGDDQFSEEIMTNIANAYLFDLSLVLRQV